MGWLYGHSDWRCASESARCVGGAEYCVRFVFLCTPFCHFLFSSGATRLLHFMQVQNIHTYILWSRQHVEAVCSTQIFCQTGKTRGNRVIGYRQLDVGFRLGGVWGPLQMCEDSIQTSRMCRAKGVKILWPNLTSIVCRIAASYT